MTRQKRTVAQHAEPVEPAADVASRPHVLPGGASGARSSGDASPVGRPSKLGVQLMALLADGKPWRTKHLVAWAEGVRRSAVHTELKALWREGRVTKPRNGLWLLAGMPKPAAADIPPMRTERPIGPKERKLLAMLSEPTLTMRLADEIGTSRQRVDKILKELLADGKVTRVRDPTFLCRWLWMRSDLDLEAAMRHLAPLLPNALAKVLNALEQDGFHCIVAVGKALNDRGTTVRARVLDLEARGLAVSFMLNKRRYVGITALGLEHPSRAPQARAAVADLSEDLGEKRGRFLETLAALGQARTIDLTAALVGEERAGLGLLPGRQIAVLTRSGLVEPVPGLPGTRRFYRLTEAGRRAASLVAHHRPTPKREALEGRIVSYRAKQWSLVQASGNRRSGIERSSPSHEAILDALAAGPLPTGALRQLIAQHAPNTNQVRVILHDLTRRKAIRAVGTQGKATVWALRK